MLAVIFYAVVPTAITVFLYFLTQLLKFYRFQTKYYDFFSKQNVNCLATSFPFGTKEKLDLIEDERLHYVKHQKIYGRYDGHTPVLTVGERELVDKILFTDFNKFPNRRDMKTGEETFDNTLFTLEGKDWKRVRNIVKIGFTHSNLKMMMSLLEEISSNLMKEITEEIQDEGSFHCQKYFKTFVLRAIARCAFGVTIEDEEAFIRKSDALFISNWKTKLITQFPNVLKFFKGSVLNGDTMEFYKKVMMNVVEKRKQLEENKCNDFLQRMLEHESDKYNNNNEVLSHSEMLSQCVTFFLAGYEATNVVLSHIMYRLAKNQECQEKVFEEIERFLPKEKIDEECRWNEELYNNLGKMKYLEVVIKECLRMCPPMVRIERRAAEDYTFSNGVELKEGFLVSIPIFAIHYDPDYYDDPETFKPDRFYYADRKEFKSIYFPFGAGGRECVGKNFVMMQIKMCVVSILQNYEVLPGPRTPEKLKISDVRNVCKVEDVEVILKRRT